MPLQCASVANLAIERGIRFQRILVLYGLERLLYRLSVSPHADRFILKGAALFSVWFNDLLRSTRDLDLLGSDVLDLAEFVNLFRGFCLQCDETDGIHFDPNTVSAKWIREMNRFGSVRITLIAELARAKFPLQVDIGFGDVLGIPAQTVEFPVLLKGSAIPRVLAYQMETAIAEKVHTLVVLERANSRMKDFFDLYILCEEFSFKKQKLASVVREVFERRETPITDLTPDGLTEAFATDTSKKTQWKAFLNEGVSPPRNSLDLSAVIVKLAQFLLPVPECVNCFETHCSVFLLHICCVVFDLL